MICPNCEGKKFIEYEHGLIQVECENCQGTGEVPDDIPIGEFNVEGSDNTVEPKETMDELIDRIRKQVAGGKPDEEEVKGTLYEGDYGASANRIRPDNQTTFIGLCFKLTGKRTDEYTIDELWGMAKEASLGKMVFPYTIEMPCGAIQRIKEGHQVVTLQIEDIPCPCGNPNHYMVRFIDNREVIDDDSNSGAKQDNKPTGGGDTGKPKQSRKPKAGRKASKRLS